MYMSVWSIIRSTYFIFQILKQSLDELKFRYHPKGTMVTIEGPRFSSRAESKMFRMWGGDVINMTTVPEVVLAKEAGLLYAAIALATDYDCWREDEEAVSAIHSSPIRSTCWLVKMFVIPFIEPIRYIVRT